MASKNSRRATGKNCGLCGGTVSNMKRHMLESHLPYYWLPHQCCVVCTMHIGSGERLWTHHLDVHEGKAYQFNSIQEYVARMRSFMTQVCTLLCQSDDLQCLLTYVCEKQLFPPKDPQRVDFNEMETILLNFIREDGITSAPKISPPDCVASLYHWRIASKVLGELSQEDQERLRKIDEVSFKPSVPPGFIADAHFHLDTLESTTNLQSFAKIEQGITEGTELLPLRLAIANYVFPGTLKKIHHVEKDDRLYYTAGIHPHMADTKITVEEVLQLLDHPKCVGVGEVGLDFTSACRCTKHRGSARQQCTERKHRRQEEFLCELFPEIRKRNMTIVIHTNGEGADSRVVELLRNFGLTSHRVHWHCFTGTSDTAKLIQDACKEAKFSFSRLSVQKPEVKQALRQIPLDKIVLETDSPYLDIFHQKKNTPWAIPGHAQEIARIKNIPMEVLLQLAYLNTCALYKLTPVSGNLPVTVTPSPRKSFQGSSCVFSNMFPCLVHFHGWEYHSTEQAYQHLRAKDIDPGLAAEILKSQDGFHAKSLSKRLDAHRRAAWNEQHSVKLMRDLLSSKAKQVPEFSNALQESEGTLLLEATTDTHWGVGVKVPLADTLPLAEMPGSNVLGWLLMELRCFYSGRPVHYLHALYQAFLGIPFYEGIGHVFGVMPTNRD